jgi:nicotinate-nucleotide adenylyltransferase
VGGRGLSGQRWGVLGGTFDPVHFAHLAIAEQVRDALDLGGVLFIPAAQPVHKPPAIVSQAEHRARMVELAIADNAHFDLSRVELDRPSPSYSVDTMRQLTAVNPEREFFFIVSVEAVRQLPTWREPQELLELCRLVIVPRLGYEMPDRSWLKQHFAGAADRFVFVRTTELGHSASDIRARVLAGRSVRYLVPSAVEQYIKENRLYIADD